MSGSYDPRITAYFGDAVMRAGFMPTPHLFLRHYAQLGLGHAEAMFVLQLMEINWDLAAPPKTVNDIARRMGVHARSVRRYSETVAALGLITLYDQYDDSGAQIENGYDLSPLFERLAAFAPEPPLGGQARRRERRTSSGGDLVPQTASPYAAAGSGRRPPDGSVRGTPDRSVTGWDDLGVRGTPDGSITDRLIDPSGLKTEKRIPQEQESMMYHAAGQQVADTGAGDAPPGWSLRQGQPLSAAEVAQTDSILQRIGIDLPVRSRIRASLAPAEAWTLWTYARAKRWSVPLLINAVYDKAVRQARPAALPQHYDAVGASLARLDPDKAEQLLDLVAEQWPDASLPPLMELVGTPPAPDTVAALEAVWRMIADVRRLPGKPCPLSAAIRQTVAPPPQMMTWVSVLDRIAAQVAPREFTTWLQETTLIELDATSAFVGASNVFAREHIEAAYLDTIQQTLSEVLGRSVRVQIVIATPWDSASRSSMGIRSAR